MEQGEIDSVSW